MTFPRNLGMRAFLRKTIYVLGWFALPAALALAVAVLTGVYYYGHYTRKASTFDLSKIGELKQRSAIYDMHGEFYSHLPGMNRQIVPLDKVSGWFIQALIAREDSTFWTHHGVEPRSVARAALANFRGGGIKQGASTLTQQLARNAFELTGRNYDRKATEAALALRMEKEMSKQQILEAYVNRIYFGSGFYGIEAAARGYFGKPAAELTLGESAMLAGLICSPNKLSPARHMAEAVAARDEVLGRMQEEQMLKPSDVSAAKAAKIAVTTNPAFPSELDYVTDAVTRALGDVLDPEVIDRGGLRVFCTIDPQLQKNAETAADRHLTEIEKQKKFPHPRRADFKAGADDNGNEKPTEYLQSAIVVVDNKTGAVRACVGGRDFDESKYQRALISYRQIGSTFKPFVYAAAFQRGMSPETPVSDDKIQPGELQQVSNKWSPENSDGEYTGIHPAAWGLIKSRNTMSVRIGQAVGLPGVRKLANAVGIGERMPNLPVSFLGAFETTLRDLTAAYTVFATGGVYHAPFLISKVENDRGEVIFQAKEKETRALSSEAAWMTNSILQEVMRSGTAAKAAQLGWKKPGAGKTGTTNDFHDAWFVGCTTSLTCGVWVGMDRPQTIMEKGYGSALALPVWVDVMNSAPEQVYPARAFEAPVQMMKARLCASTGMMATQGCEQAHTAYDAELPANRMPKSRCSAHPDPIAAPPQSFAFGGTPAQPQSAMPPANNPPLQPFNAPVQRATPPSASEPYTTGPGGQTYRIVRTPSGLQIFQGTATPSTQAAPARTVQATPYPKPAAPQVAQATPYPQRATPQVAAVPHPRSVETPAYVPTQPRRVIVDEQPRSVSSQRPRPAQPEEPREVQPEPRYTTRNRQVIGRDGLTDEERQILNERRAKRTATSDERPRRSAEPEERDEAPTAPSRGSRVVVRRAEPLDSDLRVRSPRELDRMMADDEHDHRLFKKPLFGHRED